MITLERRGGRPLRIGHRGAAALAPENTLRSFRRAIEVGVDLIEFDILELSDGALVVAHSDDLREVSHGVHEGTIRDHSLASLRKLCPDLPTLDDALSFFADEAIDVNPHLDLKVHEREPDIVAALRRFGLEKRSLVSTFSVRSARALAKLDAGIRSGITLPRSVLGISESGRGAFLAHFGLGTLRRVMPLLVKPSLRLARGRALVLHHTLVGEEVVRRAHRQGVPVVTWTVDDVSELARVDAAGVDAVVTNDPRIFVSTLKE